MSFAKAFGFSLIAFIGLNVVFFLIGYGIMGTLDSFFDSLASTPLNIIPLIFGPLASLQYPFMIINQIIMWVGGMTIETGSVILLIGFVLAPLIAAILSGRFGDNKIQSFGGWFLTAMVTSLVILIWAVIDILELPGPVTAEFIISVVITYIGIGLVYGLIYGCISLLVAKEEY